MDVSSMLANGAHDGTSAPDARRQNHQYATRHSASTHHQLEMPSKYPTTTCQPLRESRAASATSGYSPAKKGQKHVVFQLVDLQDPRIQARLPMRVMISTHDSTESIIATVKNFYGLYDYGVSFENKEGVSIIAAYDNFENDMIVYVRTVVQPPRTGSEPARDSTSPKKPTLGAPFEMRPPLNNPAYSPSRSIYRSAGARSLSPQSDIDRRSASAAPGGKLRLQRTKSKDNSVYGDADGYSSGDNGEGSVTSSRRSKTEVVNAEISVDNIVEGGRRKRAFESSELPLFVPPQVPMNASTSSISPQRNSGPPNRISPYGHPSQQVFSYTQPLPSPQSCGGSNNHFQTGMKGVGYSGTFQRPSRQLRDRLGSGTNPPMRQSAGGILPTPDPTVGSVISDEDVALQLMRLGDPMAFSNGRTSTSTVDDAFSGKAEATSSDEEEDDGEGEEGEEHQSLVAAPGFSQGDIEPLRKKQRTMNGLPSEGTSGEEYEDRRDGTFAAGADQNGHRKKFHHGKSRSINVTTTGFGKASKPRADSVPKPKTKLTSHQSIPMSPASVPVQSRKTSVASTINFQNQLGADEEDLSSQPRCQRCRKSKKGCDRQRPCGRCRDAGIGIEGCISEDEGNGRKGRYGRHMGVPVKKGEEAVGGAVNVTDDAAAGGIPAQLNDAPANGYFLAPALPDKSKKRKR